MRKNALLELLAAVECGKLSAIVAADRLANLPFEDIGDARIDHHRSLRVGLPEVIYAEGKSAEQTATIFARMAVAGQDVLATRVSSEAADAVIKLTPSASYSSKARTISLQQTPQGEGMGTVAILCAGTSDLGVAEEAAVTAELFGCVVLRLYDIGVAGLPRLLGVREQLQTADAVVVCAGMEGALPSVVGGLVSVPVLAVPTSVGYGASFAGVSALLGMLNSCSPNVSVVNIDNGFGAAYSAVLIARSAHKGRANASSVPSDPTG